MSSKDLSLTTNLEDRYRAILEQSPFSIQVLSPDGYTIQVNKAWEKLWGVTLEQIRDYNMLEDEQLEQKGVMPYIRRAFAGEAAEIPPILYDPEETIPGKTQNPEPRRWTKAVIYPVKDDEGKVLEVILMHEDITARMLAEEKLKRSESRYRSLFETTPDGVLIVNEEGIYVDVNESYCRILKTSREDLIGSHFSRHMVPDRLEKATRAFTDLKEKGHFEGDFPMLAADGSIVELEWWSKANFTPGLHVCVARDVTERRLAEEALRESEARYRSLLENANDIIYSHDLQGNYLSINRAGERITGYTQEEVLGGMSFAQVVVPEHLEMAREMIARKLKNSDPTVYEVDIFAKNGQRLTLEVSTRISYRNEMPIAVEGIARDITERKRIEQEKQRLARQVENQKKRLQAIVSNVPCVVWEAFGEPDEKSQRIDFINDYVQTMLGYTVEEWLSTPNFWLTIVHADDREEAARKAYETFQSGKPGINQFRWIAKDGRAFWVETQSVTIFDESGKPVGMRGVTMDISSRKQKEIHERFLAEASVMLASSLDYEITLANVANLAVPHFADWCSVDVANQDGTLSRLAVAHIDQEKIALADEIYRRYPPDPSDAQGVFNVLRTGISEFYPEISDDLLVGRSRDEEHLRILREIGFRSVIIVPLKLRDQVLGVITFTNADSRRHHAAEDLALAEELARRAALVVDNAKLFRAEQQIRLAAERTSDFLRRLQSVSSSLSQVLIPADVAIAVIEQGISSLGAHAGTVVVFDETGTELEVIETVGFPKKIVDNWRRFKLSQNVPLAEAIRGNAPVVIESFSEYQEKYPELAALSSATGSQALIAYPLIAEGRIIGAMGLTFPQQQKFTEEDRHFLLALAHQCAQALERARLYENEQRMRAQAEQANRMKDEFLATVSHELRTPLNAIVGWSNMLAANRLPPDVAARALETIERNAKAQSQIIEDLLDVSRIITGKLSLNPGLVKLESVIDTTLQSLQPAAETKNIRVKSNLGSDAGIIWGDADRLQQVMWNLLSNAIKFTPEGGEVAVSLERIQSFVKITVEDTGQGISPEFLPYVFDRFSQADSTTSRKFGGLGLGLAIVRHLIEMHGGTVKVESPGAGQGTTFTVTLPVKTKENVPGNAEQASLSFSSSSESGKPRFGNDLGNVRILVVDDDEDARVLLATILEGSGAEVALAGSASEALETFGSFKPQILISDIGMPEEDGYMLIQRIRNLEGGSIPAIALSAYAREEDRAKAEKAGFELHAAKPIEPEELIKVVKKLRTTFE